MFIDLVEKVKQLSKSRVKISILPGEIEQPNKEYQLEDNNRVESVNWIEYIYGYDIVSKTGFGTLSNLMPEKLKFYRYNIPNVLLNLSKMIDHTLLIEQKKLVSKEIYDSNNFDIWVLTEKPSEDGLDDLEFSNKYIKFLDKGIAFKINTRYLNNRKYLQQIGTEILNDQKGEGLQNAIYQNKQKENGKIKRSKLFSGFTLEQIDSLWYIIVNYTDQYKQEVIQVQGK